MSLHEILYISYPKVKYSTFRILFHENFIVAIFMIITLRFGM